METAFTCVNVPPLVTEDEGTVVQVAIGCVVPLVVCEEYGSILSDGEYVNLGSYL